MGYFICSGEISATFVEKTTSTVFSIVMGLSLVLHVTIFIRIRLFRLRSRAETAPTSNNKSLFLKDVDGSNLANYTVHLVCILIFLVTLFCIHRLDNIEMRELNDFPNYFCAYYINLFSPSIAMDIFILSFFHKDKVRKCFKEEVTRLLHL